MRTLSIALVLFPLTALAVPDARHNVKLSAAPRDDKLARSGQIDAWCVRGDGTVLVRLAGVNGAGDGDEQQAERFAVWYMTPADRTASTRFEHLTLAAVLDVVPREQQITIVSEAESQEQGATLADAVAIESILWGTSWQEATGVDPSKKSVRNGK